ncbi:unnamed protein product, partial [Strongylus vulgaris]
MLEMGTIVHKLKMPASTSLIEDIKKLVAKKTGASITFSTINQNC